MTLKLCQLSPKFLKKCPSIPKLVTEPFKMFMQVRSTIKHLMLQTVSRKFNGKILLRKDAIFYFENRRTLLQSLSDVVSWNFSNS